MELPNELKLDLLEHKKRARIFVLIHFIGGCFFLVFDDR